MSAAVPLRSRPAARSRVSPPRLRVVEAPRHPGRFLIVGLLIAGLGVFGTVSLNALAAEEVFEVRELEREVRELSFRYEELTAEVATLESPDRIREVAVHQLGMVPAHQPGYLRADRRVQGDAEFGRMGDIVRATMHGGELADPVKPVLGAGG